MAGIVLVAVVIDQCLKTYVHNHLVEGQAVFFTPWFALCHVENNGMAFGIEWFSKIFLTLFRIGVVAFLIWYIHRLISRHFGNGYLTMIALTLAGAIGNIIDCVFYGVIYGYAPLFYGRVVDMFYFPLIHNSHGQVIFFTPVFNVADACITVAIFAIILFYRKTFDLSFKKEQQL